MPTDATQGFNKIFMTFFRYVKVATCPLSHQNSHKTKNIPANDGYYLKVRSRISRLKVQNQNFWDQLSCTNSYKCMLTCEFMQKAFV